MPQFITVFSCECSDGGIYNEGRLTITDSTGSGMEHRTQRLEITSDDMTTHVGEFAIQRRYYLSGELERLIEGHRFRVLERSAGPESEQLVFVLSSV